MCICVLLLHVVANQGTMGQPYKKKQPLEKIQINNADKVLAVNKQPQCRGLLAQRETVSLVIILVFRLWFETCRTPSLFHAQIYFENRHDPES